MIFISCKKEEETTKEYKPKTCRLTQIKGRLLYEYYSNGKISTIRYINNCCSYDYVYTDSTITEIKTTNNYVSPDSAFLSSKEIFKIDNDGLARSSVYYLYDNIGDSYCTRKYYYDSNSYLVKRITNSNALNKIDSLGIIVINGNIISKYLKNNSTAIINIYGYDANLNKLENIKPWLGKESKNLINKENYDDGYGGGFNYTYENFINIDGYLGRADYYIPPSWGLEGSMHSIYSIYEPI